MRILAVEMLADRAPEEAQSRLLVRLSTELDRTVKDAIERALGSAPSSVGPRDRGEGGG